jgi:hypothetical protein
MQRGTAVASPAQGLAHLSGRDSVCPTPSFRPRSAFIYATNPRVYPSGQMPGVTSPGHASSAAASMAQAHWRGALTRCEAYLGVPLPWLEDGSGLSAVLTADPGDFSGTPEAHHILANLRHTHVVPRSQTVCGGLAVGTLMGEPVVVVTTGERQLQLWWHARELQAGHCRWHARVAHAVASRARSLQCAGRRDGTASPHVRAMPRSRRNRSHGRGAVQRGAAGRLRAAAGRAHLLRHVRLVAAARGRAQPAQLHRRQQPGPSDAVWPVLAARELRVGDLPAEAGVQGRERGAGRRAVVR